MTARFEGVVRGRRRGRTGWTDGRAGLATFDDSKHLLDRQEIGYHCPDLQVQGGLLCQKTTLESGKGFLDEDFWILQNQVDGERGGFD